MFFHNAHEWTCTYDINFLPYEYNTKIKLCKHLFSTFPFLVPFTGIDFKKHKKSAAL